MSAFSFLKKILEVAMGQKSQPGFPSLENIVHIYISFNAIKNTLTDNKEKKITGISGKKMVDDIFVTNLKKMGVLNSYVHICWSFDTNVNY